MKKLSAPRKPNFGFKDGGFLAEGFDTAAPFCSFLPGLTGKTGTPLWSFYCNRGQGICSFGTKNKDNAIIEFFPANAAYQHVSQLGFRTFIKTGDSFFEPFAVGGSGERSMHIFPNLFSIEEKSRDFTVTVSYFVMPEEDFPALVRRVKIVRNEGEGEVELLDGLPQIMPYGITTGGYKNVSNLNKSWTHVSGLGENLAFFHTLTAPGDEAEVKLLQGANFILSFAEDGKPLRPIIEPELVFGHDTSYSAPTSFPEAPEKQIFANKYPCAIIPFKKHLAPGEAIELCSIIGMTQDMTAFTRRSTSLCRKAYIDEKQARADSVEREITDALKTKTALPLFDGYIRQSYLDNILRGGVPVVLGDKVIHLFSRKHGDPERDYNFFSIADEFFSQGNGNFRDVCQNRRSDVVFCPEAGSVNINLFFSLVQADGFNPLEVRGATFSPKSEKKNEFDKLIKSCENYSPLEVLCRDPFTAGEAINTIHRQSVSVPRGDVMAFVVDLLALCDQNIEASYNEGYWSDHWTYLMDLVDSYREVFPDRLCALLQGERTVRFFESPVRVLPRREAYVMSSGRLRQFRSLEHLDGKPQKAWLKDYSGKIVTVTLFEKMLAIAAIKFASLDSHGMGIEMNGGRPGWNDAMNGLPGLFGSGMSETLELVRLLEFIKANAASCSLPEEIAELLEKCVSSLEAADDFKRWNEVAGFVEAYRDRLQSGLSGAEKPYTAETLVAYAEKMLDKLNKGIAKAEKLGGGLMPTYLIFEAEGLDETGFPTGFSVQALPHFLEGPTRQLKILHDKEKAREMYDKIKASDIYDKKLKMYKTSVSLDHCGFEIGRIRTFSAGWLERESVFMHMETKYLLELLKCGLYDEFYADIQTMLPPFLDPAVYGRSTTESSSFIAASCSPDPSIVGRGFVARLSGTTAEVVSMYQLMFAGDHLFAEESGALRFTLSPKLPAWLFDENGEISFTLLGKIPVTYKNSARKNTYGGDAVKISAMSVVYGDKTHELTGGSVTGELALAIRDRKVNSITAILE